MRFDFSFVSHEDAGFFGPFFYDSQKNIVDGFSSL